MKAKIKTKKNRGTFGEILVFNDEVDRLNDLGINKDVEHVAITEGEGVGYDISSYDELGNEIFIKVKTATANGKWVNEIKNDGDIIEERWDNAFDPAFSWRFETKVVFAKEKQGRYVFLGGIKILIMILQHGSEHIEELVRITSLWKYTSSRQN